MLQENIAEDFVLSTEVVRATHRSLEKVHSCFVMMTVESGAALGEIHHLGGALHILHLGQVTITFDLAGVSSEVGRAGRGSKMVS